MAKRPNFFQFCGRSLMTGTNRVGRFSQHDTLVGIAIIGAILIGPLAGGIVALALGFALLLVPSIIVAVIVIAAVFALGAYSQWQEAEDRNDLEREATAYYARLLESQGNHKENQAAHAALIDEGHAFVDAILNGGDDQLDSHRAAIDDWRQRTRDFLNEKASNRTVDGAAFYRAFDMATARAMEYKGASYTGDRALVAVQVNNATGVLSGMYISENIYLSFPSVKAMEDAEANVKARSER